MIEIRHLSKTYQLPNESVRALNDVSLEVKPGEIFGVVGPSGAGKSTLIRCVNLLEKPTSGEVIVNGQQMTALSTAELRAARQQIGMIFQHFNLLSSRTVAGNVAFPLEIIGYDASKVRARVEYLLDVVGLSDKAKVYPYQLSGGQKQRVGIARALANEPQILLSDEATSALDQQNTAAILALLKDLNQSLGLTILLITHEMDVVKQICDNVAVLQAGKILESGSIDQLISDPDSTLSRAFFPPIEELPAVNGAIAATITFLGEAASQPILARLTRQFDVDVNILGGSIQSINGKRIGRLQVQISGIQTELALASLESQGLRVEVR